MNYAAKLVVALELRVLRVVVVVLVFTGVEVIARPAGITWAHSA
jgi:hypothetical protein